MRQNNALHSTITGFLEWPKYVTSSVSVAPGKLLPPDSTNTNGRSLHARKGNTDRTTHLWWIADFLNEKAEFFFWILVVVPFGRSVMEREKHLQDPTIPSGHLSTTSTAANRRTIKETRRLNVVFRKSGDNQTIPKTSSLISLQTEKLRRE